MYLLAANHSVWKRKAKRGWSKVTQSSYRRCSGGRSGGDGGSHNWEGVESRAWRQEHSPGFIISIDFTGKAFSCDCSRCRNKPLRLDRGLERLRRGGWSQELFHAGPFEPGSAGPRALNISAHPTCVLLKDKVLITSAFLLCRGISNIQKITSCSKTSVSSALLLIIAALVFKASGIWQIKILHCPHSSVSYTHQQAQITISLY